jgi:hypothetical protein
VTGFKIDNDAAQEFGIHSPTMNTVCRRLSAPLRLLLRDLLCIDSHSAAYWFGKPVDAKMLFHCHR